MLPPLLLRVPPVPCPARGVSPLLRALLSPNLSGKGTAGLPQPPGSSSTAGDAPCAHLELPRARSPEQCPRNPRRERAERCWPLGCHLRPRGSGSPLLARAPTAVGLPPARRAKRTQGLVRSTMGMGDGDTGFLGFFFSSRKSEQNVRKSPELQNAHRSRQRLPGTRRPGAMAAR